MLASVAASPQSQDPLQQHYEAAGKFLQAGDQERAAAEYKAFLAEALHRIANGKADAGQFNAAESLFEEVTGVFSRSDLAVQLDYAKACFDADKLVKAKSLAQSRWPVRRTRVRAARFLLARVLFHLGDFRPCPATVGEGLRRKAGIQRRLSAGQDLPAAASGAGGA